MLFIWQNMILTVMISLHHFHPTNGGRPSDSNFTPPLSPHQWGRTLEFQ